MVLSQVFGAYVVYLNSGVLSFLCNKNPTTTTTPTTITTTFSRGEKNKLDIKIGLKVTAQNTKMTLKKYKIHKHV